MPKKSLVVQTVALLRERGQKSLEIARQAIGEEQVRYKPLEDALLYFADESFPHVMQPGLLSIYCEAVGGKPRDTIGVGATMTLLVAAADIHDDLVDESTTKNGKPTVLGKYGKDIAILAGDAFLIKGLYMLHEAIATLDPSKRQAILILIKQAFFDLSSAEAEEARLRCNINLLGREYFELIKRKTAVSEATAKIGAILGDGTPDEVITLGKIGYAVGLLSTLRDEFIDVFEPDELASRFKNDILPLPVLNAFQDPEKKRQILRLLGEEKLTKKNTARIVELVMKTKETEGLKKEMQILIKENYLLGSTLRGVTKLLQLLLESSIEDLQ